MIRALIVEDEPLARDTLRDLVRGVEWLDLLDAAESGSEAVRLINKYEPDLVFLDVEMPEFNGLEVLSRVQHQPAVVFTTAYDQYAATAFELEAIDYLVKPFGRRRFVSTLERVRERLMRPVEGTALERAREALREGPVRRLFARKGSTIRPFAVSTIVRVESGEQYVNVYAGGDVFLLDVSLNDLEGRLDPETFLRVHRSHIINLDHVTSMRAYDDRRLSVSMSDGSVVVASRAGSQRLRGLVTS